MPKLLASNPARIGVPPLSRPEPDAAPAALRHGSPKDLVDGLAACIGREQVRSRASDLIRYASDGSPYRCIPSVVVQPRNEDDIAAILRFAAKRDRHVTFRAAGTSLNGQAMTDDILIDLKTHFHGMEVRNGGKQLWSRCGVVLGDAQAVLARSGAMLGADPGSTSVATIGGVLAKNAGGMRCSIERDTYHSVESLRVVLPSGTVVDTAKGDAHFARLEPRLHAGLLELRDTIRADEQLVSFLRKKFSIRNTNGIRLDAFLDEDAPVDILKRLLVGSEGLFGAVTECVINTVALPATKAVAWVMLKDLRDAANYVAPLMEAGALACELLVAPVLKHAVGNFPDAPESWLTLPDDAAALLLEVGGANEAELDAAIARAEAALEGASLIEPVHFMREPREMLGAWQIRNGLFGLLGADRKQGTTMITEDVCFPPAKIGEGAADMLDLLARYGYPEMVMGHAAFGNLHFFLLPNLADASEREAYAQFLDDMAEIVIDKYHGSLKAEHGTGVNMAPFLLREWGEQAWELMWKVKELIDPQGILAPDVKLTRDQQVHMRNFKSFPKIEDEINACVECGFCEPVCPSRHATVTPRQRIVLRREMARQPEGSPLITTLQEEYQYDAIDMCAADGSCAIACPISIDTGKVMKEMRAKQVSAPAARVALKGAQQWAVAEKLIRAGLISANAVGARKLKLAADATRTVVSPDVIPTIPGDLPQAAKRLPRTHRQGATAVYFPACINRMFGNSPNANAEHLTLPEAIVELGRRSGAPVWIPEDVTGDCCGTPWSSKGYKEGFAYHAVKIVEDLWRWSDEGTLPIVIDAASCTHGLLDSVPKALSDEQRARYERLRILDAVTWLAQEVVPHLPITTHMGRIAVHPTCSVRHMHGEADLVTVANAAGEAHIPDGAGCCGSAGDRVMLHPELTESATREERASLQAGQYDAFISSNRTCEMGLEMITGEVYEHVAVLLERASRPTVTP